MEWLFLLLIILFFSSKTFRAGLRSSSKKRHNRNHHRTNYKSVKSVKHKPTKVVGGGNPWQKRNAKYAKQDAKREKRQDRTGNK